MKTKIIEGVQDLKVPGNWGKFLVAEPDTEFTRRSQVSTGYAGSLLTSCGWTDRKSVV